MTQFGIKRTTEQLINKYSNKWLSRDDFHQLGTTIIFTNDYTCETWEKSVKGAEKMVNDVLGVEEPTQESLHNLCNYCLS